MGNLKCLSQGHTANVYRNKGDDGHWLLPQTLVSLPLEYKHVVATTVRLNRKALV